MGKKIIAYDLGTGGNKASLYDLDGNVFGKQKMYETAIKNAATYQHINYP